MDKLKKYRKALSFLTAAAMAVSMAGCSSSSDESTPENTPDRSAEVVDEIKEPAEDTADISEKASVNRDYSALFSDRDKAPSFDNASSNVILSNSSVSISGDGVSAEGSKITITEEGIYHFSGTLSDGQIIVNAPKGKVQIILDNADITCSDSSPILGVDSDKIFISLAPDSKNSLTANGSPVDETAPDACIYSADSITVNGSGELTVDSRYSDGIHSKDDVVITGGRLTVSAYGDGIKGKDYTAICGGTVDITCGGDGICAKNSKDPSLGFIYIEGGEFTVNSDHDAMQAETDLVITGGTFGITCGGGSDNSDKVHMDDFGGGFKGFGDNSFKDKFGDRAPEDFGDFDPSEFGGMTPPEGMAPPEGFDLPQGGFGGMAPPEGMELPDGVAPPEGGFGGRDNVDNNNTNETSEDSSDSAKGLKGVLSVEISGGTLRADCADDAIHSNGDVIISGGELTLLSGDDGIHGDASVDISGGTVAVEKSYEGIEAAVINIRGGDISVISEDDGLNASDGSPQQGLGTYSAAVQLNISGGTLYVNADGDGIDSNGDMTISGGIVTVDGPTGDMNGALDSNSDIVITGGTVIAAGSAGMAEYPGDKSTQHSVSVTFDNALDGGTTVTLADKDGAEIVSYTPSKKFKNIIISSPDIKSGETYTVSAGGTEVGTFTADDMTSFIGGRSGGFGSFGGFGGKGDKDFGGRGGRGDKGDRQIPTNENGEPDFPGNDRSKLPNRGNPREPGNWAMDES